MLATATMRLALLGLALGLAQLYDCCYPKSRIRASLTLLALIVTVSLVYRPVKVALLPKLAMIPMKVSRVEEKDAAQQKTEWRCRHYPSRVTSYTFHRQINK